MIQVLERFDPAVFQARLQVPRQPTVVRLAELSVRNSTMPASFPLSLLALCRNKPQANQIRNE